MMSIGKYKIENGRVHFITLYDPGFISDVKTIAGRTYHPNEKTWSVPNNFVTSKLVEALIEKYDLKKMTSDVSNGLDDTIISTSIEIAVETKLDLFRAKIKEMNWPITPREYQLRGIVYNLIAKKALNGSDMGTGKTFTSIFTIELAELFPCIVMVPASVKYNWAMQWKRVNPNRSVSVINNAKGDFGADVLIMTYDTVGKKEKDSSLQKGYRAKFKHEQLNFIPFKSIICDEAQNVKSSKTLRSMSVKMVSKQIDYKFLLTGTSIMNRPVEIINLLGIMGHFDTLFTSWHSFVYRYCDAKDTRFGIYTKGASNALELNQKMRELCYFRVEKRDVLTELPDLEETILEVDLENSKEYQRAENDLVNYMKDNYGQEKADKAMAAEQLVMLSTLNTLAAKGKYSEVCDWLNNFLEATDEKIIVFGIHTEMLKDLAIEYNAPLIIGEVDHKHRQKIIDNFKVNNKRILFMNLMTGSVGIDGLQNICNTILFYEYPWRWADIDQAISRLERDGQKNNIQVYYMQARNTIDQKMWEVILSKKEITDAVNKGKEVSSQNYMASIVRSIINKS